MSDTNVKFGVFLSILTVPLSAVNVNEFLILLNSSSVKDVFGCVISLSITGATVFGVYLSFWIKTLNLTVFAAESSVVNVAASCARNLRV